MITNFFAVIQLILKAFQVWDAFMLWMSDNYSKEMEIRRQKRDQAIEDSKKAETDDEIWKSQDDISRNPP
jgi:hypothetical protein